MIKKKGGTRRKKRRKKKEKKKKCAVLILKAGSFQPPFHKVTLCHFQTTGARRHNR